MKIYIVMYRNFERSRKLEIRRMVFENLSDAKRLLKVILNNHKHIYGHQPKLVAIFEEG
jgi:hypothetical protein